MRQRAKAFIFDISLIGSVGRQFSQLISLIARTNMFFLMIFRMFRQRQLDVSAVWISAMWAIRKRARFKALCETESQHLHQHSQFVGLLVCTVQL